MKNRDLLLLQYINETLRLYFSLTTLYISMIISLVAYYCFGNKFCLLFATAFLILIFVANILCSNEIIKIEDKLEEEEVDVNGKRRKYYL